MSPVSKALVEGYAFEIVLRSRSIRAECKGLLSKDYASNTPINLACVIRDTCSYLEDVVMHIYRSRDWADSDEAKSSLKLLQKTDWLIKEIGSCIRFVDGAQTHKLPWSFIRPLEEMVAKFMPVFDEGIVPSNLEVMLRPKWKYNYTVHLGNLYKLFSTQLSNYAELQSLPGWVGDLRAKRFHIISFPLIERKDILLHCLLGHEMGHFAAEAFLTSEREAAFLQYAVKQLSLASAADKGEHRQKQANLVLQASDAWKRGSQELFSDIAGAILFGPSLLLAMLEVALQDPEGLDSPPMRENQFYPPWRMRLRVILDVLKEMKLVPLPAGTFTEHLTQSVNERFREVEDIVSLADDQSNIDKNLGIKVAYEGIRQNTGLALKEFREKLTRAGLAATKDELYSECCPNLIERLQHGIPPNAVENGFGDCRAVRIVHVVNAAWFFRIANKDNLSSCPLDKLCGAADTLNRLCLKAIEYSFITNGYKSHVHG